MYKGEDRVIVKDIVIVGGCYEWVFINKIRFENKW